MFKTLFGPMCLPLICFEAENEGAGGGETTEKTTETTSAETGTGTTETAGKWWEGSKFNEDQRKLLTTVGLTLDDPLDAVVKLVDMESAAKKRLGASPGDLLTKPKDGENVGEWLRKNGGAFGIPESADKYEINKPENWPDGAPWDGAMEEAARKIAHENGVSGPALQQLTDLYAGEIGKLAQTADTDLAAATDAMRGELARDWGDQLDSRLASAQSAAQMVAERAGLDAEALGNLGGLLGKKLGDPQAIRMFAAIGEMMGEDNAAGLRSGASTLGTTPADARAQLAKLRGPDGEYTQAKASGDRAKIKGMQTRMAQLYKISGQT